MVVLDGLTKVPHFILVKSMNSISEVAHILIKYIMRLHGVPKNIVSYRDAKFTSKFWKELFGGFGKDLAFNTTYYP